MSGKIASKVSFWKMALVATGSLMISSCSKLDLIYSWSENYLVYELDHYFDLTNSQENKIKKEFKKKINLFLIENDQKIMKYIGDYQQMIVIGEFDPKHFEKTIDLKSIASLRLRSRKYPIAIRKKAAKILV